MNGNIEKTRFKELGYSQIDRACWMFFDLNGDKPAQVGLQYASKAELLADCERYAADYGCDGAIKPTPLIEWPALAALPEGIDYIGFNCCTTARAWRDAHGGWMFTPDSGIEFIWFAMHFTPSLIMAHHATRGMTGTVDCERRPQ